MASMSPTVPTMVGTPPGPPVQPTASTNGSLKGYHHHHHHHMHHVHHVHHYQQEPYELSQDLIAKQLELLEKKYGGSHKAKEAALTIQRAFRRSVSNPNGKWMSCL